MEAAKTKSQLGKHEVESGDSTQAQCGWSRNMNEKYKVT